MTTLRRLIDELKSLHDDIHERFWDAENNRQREFDAAVTIQSWYRALLVRRRMKLLRSLSTDIQRIWRGFVGRRIYRDLMKNKVYGELLENYHEKATLIQRIWRGYYVRRYIFNYYAQKRYLQALVVKNDAIRKQLQSYEQEIQQQHVKETRQAELKAVEQWAYSNHHLRSTAVIPGVLTKNRIQSATRSCSENDAEALLRSVKPKPSENYLSKMNPMIRLEKELDLDHAAQPYYVVSRDPVLPPLEKVAPKPQGPFKAMEDVLKQRYKPFNASIRVQSDYYSVEKTREHLRVQEAGMNLHDLPLRVLRKPDLPYQAMELNKAPYTLPKYGTKHLRELQEPPVPFKTTLPPIPIFDHFNDTYLRGTVGL